jgi:hypothetical protein
MCLREGLANRNSQESHIIPKYWPEAPPIYAYVEKDGRRDGIN